MYLWNILQKMCQDKVSRSKYQYFKYQNESIKIWSIKIQVSRFEVSRKSINILRIEIKVSKYKYQDFKYQDKTTTILSIKTSNRKGYAICLYIYSMHVHGQLSNEVTNLHFHRVLHQVGLSNSARTQSVPYSGSGWVDFNCFVFGLTRIKIWSIKIKVSLF